MSAEAKEDGDQSAQKQQGECKEKAQCTFSQDGHTLTCTACGKVVFSSAAYAGGHGQGNDRQSSADQSTQSQGDHTDTGGPLPQGVYDIGPNTGRNGLANAWRLNPRAGTQMYGRAGFWIHAAARSDPRGGSEGCIVLTLEPRALLARVLQQYGGGVLTVTK